MEYTEGLVAGQENAPKPKFNRAYGLVGAVIGVSVMTMGAVAADSSSSSSSPSSVLVEGDSGDAANVWIAVAGEKDMDGSEITPSPDLSSHRDLRNWDDADVDQFWNDASDWLEETWGVPDLASWPIVDTSTGARQSPDGNWRAKPQIYDLGMGAFSFDSTTATYALSPDDLAPLFCESIAIDKLTPGGFYDLKGYDSMMGDSLAYGTYFLDLARNGEWTPMHMESNIPARPGPPGYMVIDETLYIEDWGTGVMHSTMTMSPTAEGGVHASFRSVISFPPEPDT